MNFGREMISKNMLRNGLAFALVVLAAVLLPATVAGQEMTTLPLLPIIFSLASVMVVAASLVAVSILGFWMLIMVSVVAHLHSFGAYISQIV